MTNPFKHRYHADHDDLTAAFAAPPANLPVQEQEVWAVTRAVTLTFSAPSAGDLALGGGYSRRAGTFRETVTGLHKTALVTTGTFTLHRFNTLGEINSSRQLWVAALTLQEDGKPITPLRPPKWRARSDKPPAPTTGELLRLLRYEYWASALRPGHFCHFATGTHPDTSAQKCTPDLPATIFRTA